MQYANKLKNWLRLTVGMIATALGIIGIFLPLLPTTPFLLLASICFARSSDKMYHWLLSNTLFGEQFSDYLIYRTISPQLKVGSITFLWLAIGFSILKFNTIYIRILLLIIAIAVTIHLYCLRTKREEDAHDKIQY